MSRATITFNLNDPDDRRKYNQCNKALKKQMERYIKSNPNADAYDILDKIVEYALAECEENNITEADIS